MLTSHRFSCSLGTISLYFEDEALIGLDLEGSAGCGERLMAQLARHGIDPAAFRPEATPAALAVEQWLVNYACRQQGPLHPAPEALRHPVPDLGVERPGSPRL